MPDRSGPQLSDEALDQLARRWFADARTEQPKAPASNSRVGVAGDSGLLDWLFGGDDGDGAEDDGD